LIEFVLREGAMENVINMGGFSENKGVELVLVPNGRRFEPCYQINVQLSMGNWQMANGGIKKGPL
jgi:hypothetical protein